LSTWQGAERALHALFEESDMSDREIKPAEVDEQFGERFEDRTFGCISFSRTHGTPQPLFGSSIKHSNQILLEVKTAHMWRNLNMDRVHGDKMLVRVIMSPTQFADAITSMNSGEIPVTLDYVAGQGHFPEGAPFQNKVRQFNDEFTADIGNLGKDFDAVINLAEQCKAQKRLVQALEQLKMHFVNNIPFVAEQFAEQMEKTVTEAKGEIEAFTEGKVRQYGLEALRAQLPSLGETTTKLLKTGEDAQIERGQVS
jgi:hypothetical protein